MSGPAEIPGQGAPYRPVPAVECPSHGDPGPAPDLRWIDPADLVVDDTFQRKFSDRHGAVRVRKIAREFSWRAFGALVVCACGDGRYSVLDGQHRAAAAQGHGAIGKVPCIVVMGDGADQARAFTRINLERAGLDRAATFHAKVAAGDAEALALKAVLDEAGVKVQRNPHPEGVRPLHTRAIGPLYQIRKKLGEVHLLDALDMIATAWPESRNQFGGQQVWAVALMVKAVHEAEDDLDRLAKLVAETDLEDLKDRAKAYGKQFGGGAVYKHMADMLMHQFNKGRRVRLVTRFAA